MPSRRQRQRDAYNYYKYETVGFSKFKLNCVGAFHSIVMDRVLSASPSSASVLENQRRMAALHLHRSGETFSYQRQGTKSDFLRQDRIYVACETTDDIPYIVNKLGDDNIVIGSDYAHADSATELLAIHNLSADPRLTPSLAKKIVSDNARALYGL